MGALFGGTGNDSILLCVYSLIQAPDSTYFDWQVSEKIPEYLDQINPFRTVALQAKHPNDYGESSLNKHIP